MNRNKWLIAVVCFIIALTCGIVGLWFFYPKTPKKGPKAVTFWEDDWEYSCDFEEAIFIPHAKLIKSKPKNKDEEAWNAITAQILESEKGEGVIVHMKHFDQGRIGEEGDEFGIAFFLELTDVQIGKEVQAGKKNQAIVYKYDFRDGANWYVYSAPKGLFKVTSLTKNSMSISMDMTFKKRLLLYRSDESDADLRMIGYVRLKEAKAIEKKPMPTE